VDLSGLSDTDTGKSRTFPETLKYISHIYFFISRPFPMKGGNGKDHLASLSPSGRDEGDQACAALAPRVCNVRLL
jgi:hypothetical protein